MTIRWRSKSLNFFGLLALLLTSSANSGRESIYYRSQKDADTALAAFDQANPDCQLWTNWQKMCSRMGNSQISECTQSDLKRHRASAPFCVVRQGGLQVFEYDRSSRESESYFRFCSERQIVYAFDGMNTRSASYCRKFIESRPFRIFSKAVPWNNWCNKTKRAGRNEVRCLTIKSPKWCAEIGSVGAVKFDKNAFETGRISTIEKYSVDSSPVTSLYCAKLSEMGK